MHKITIGYSALVRAASKHEVRVSFGNAAGSFHDVSAVCVRGARVSAAPNKNEPGEYDLRPTSLAGSLFVSLLAAGGV